jgi:hypothetical protein
LSHAIDTTNASGCRTDDEPLSTANACCLVSRKDSHKRRGTFSLTHQKGLSIFVKEVKGLLSFSIPFVIFYRTIFAFSFQLAIPSNRVSTAISAVAFWP